MNNKSFKIVFAAIIFIASSLNLHASDKQTMWDVITSDNKFSMFALMIENAGVEHLFNGKTSINATVYIPTNSAFSTLPTPLISALRYPENKIALIRLIRSHYFIGTYNDMKEGDYFITTNINGDQIRIEQAKNLFVKDMVIQNDPIYVGKNKIIPVDCVMYVQTSKSDHRLSLEQQESFSITSCCLQSFNEASDFVRSTNFDPEGL